MIIHAKRILKLGEDDEFEETSKYLAIIYTTDFIYWNFSKSRRTFCIVCAGCDSNV
ncbi:hypothetical protein EMIT019CA3_50147 [Bacillus pseudomycoides]